MTEDESKSRRQVLHGGQLDLLLQFHHVFPEEAVRVHQVFDRLAGVDHCSMITTAKMLADRFQGIFGELEGVGG